MFRGYVRFRGSVIIETGTQRSFTFPISLFKVFCFRKIKENTVICWGVPLSSNSDKHDFCCRSYLSPSTTKYVLERGTSQVIYVLIFIS